VVASPVTPLRPAQPGGAQAVLCDSQRASRAGATKWSFTAPEGSEVDGVKVVTVPAPGTPRRRW